MVTPISPSWTWGSSATLIVNDPNAGSGRPIVSAQLAQVSLPEPAVCSVYFQASMTTADPRDVVRSFTLNLSEGIGRVTVPRQLSFPNQPAAPSPLEFTIPFMPVHALNVDCQAAVDVISGAPDIRIEVYMVLSPLTRIPQKEQKLAFGMAMPGEADDLDDDLREELEAEGPTAAQTVAGAYESQVDGSDGLEPDDDGDDDDDGEQVPRVPAWVMGLIQQLEARLGRRPTRLELAAAVKRLRARKVMREAQRRSRGR